MAEPCYRVYGLDRQLYGPVPESTLHEWAADGRVQRESWIHREPGDTWQRAEELDELAGAFGTREIDGVIGHVAPEGGPAESHRGVPTKVLTRLKVFSELAPEELDPFAQAMVEEAYRPFTFIVQQGSHGEAMYFVLQGKVGVSTKGQVTESFLVTLNIGDTFGEMSLFDPGPRSADVRAENDVVVLKLTAEALRSICREAPTAANRFLWAMSRLLSARMRAMDKRAATAKDMDAAGRGAK